MKKTKLLKKGLGTAVAMSMVCSGISWEGVQSFAADAGIESSYVVMTTRQTVSNQIADKYDGEQLDENAKVITVDLTKSEAETLDAKSGVIVEKDIMFSGSGVETSADIETYELPQLEDQIDNPWNMQAIGVEKSDSNKHKVKVELLDTGVSGATDIELAGYEDLVRGQEEDYNPLFMDDNGHGTALAGVMCAQDDNSGIVGVNPNMDLYAVKALDSNNQAPLSRIIEGIYWGIDNDMDIINMSFGTTKDSEILHKAVSDAHKAGILMVGAAGNTNHKEVQFPAAYKEVIAVGSMGTDGDLAEVTSFGTELELLAPGENIITNGFYQIPVVVEGTSIATAEVTGIASLLYGRTQDNQAKIIRGLLKSTAKQIDAPQGKALGVVDYASADEKFDKYVSSYHSEEEVPYTNEESVANYEEEAEEMVNGLWDKSVHENMVGTTRNNISAHQLEIVRKAATLPDNSSIKESDAKELHGADNYVGDLKYLWYLSVFMGREDTNNTDSGVTSAIIRARKNAKEKLENTDVAKKDTYKHLTEASGSLIRFGLKAIKEDSELKETKSSRACQLLLWGYACHLIGDTYSHRTTIPKNTKLVRTGLAGSNQFLAADFNLVDKFEASYKAGGMEYRAMKNYWRISSVVNSKYIDNPDFFKNRWVNANNCVNNFLKRAIAEESTFSVNAILPSKAPDNSKLHYLSKYCAAAGITSTIKSAYSDNN